MTQRTREQQGALQAAAERVAAKFQSFHQSLPADEQLVLNAALQRTMPDVEGFAILSPGVVRMLGQLQGLVNDLTKPIDWDKAFEGVSVYYPQ
ncbi:MAG: hypothetical protein HYX51_11270 [Chloroflexi bacterium]|nr:hypothetical protein [Chloroflexota bacterium]